MLRSLVIHNFALIDKLEIDFQPGLTVITGETGAGKSMLIQALASFLSERATPDQVRKGANSAAISAIFETERGRKFAGGEDLDFEADAEGLVILRREIPISGPSKSYINDARVNAKTLVTVAQELLDLTGQFEHQQLLRRQVHRRLLDEYGGLHDLTDAFATVYRRYIAISAAIAELRGKQNQAVEKREFLEELTTSVRAVDPQPGEDHDLAARLKRVENSAEFSRHIENVVAALFEGEESATTIIDAAARELSAAAQLDPSLRAVIEDLRGVQLQLEPIQEVLRRYRSDEEIDPDEIDVANRRLREIQDLCRKYNGTIEEVLAKADAADQELFALGDFAKELTKLQGELAAAKSEAEKLGTELTKRRHEVGLELTNKVCEILGDLNMPNARMETAIRYFRDPASWYSYKDDPVKVEEHGADQVEFLFSANKGEEVKPLAQIASGGELSRVLLALKHSFLRNRTKQCIIFDEVDSGIGGDTAAKVGRRLQDIGRSGQVLCITHSPQVAACGTTHIRITKLETQDRTSVGLEVLSDKTRIEEVARMISGEGLSETAALHAEQLIRSAVARN